MAIAVESIDSFTLAGDTVYTVDHVDYRLPPAGNVGTPSESPT